MSRPGRGCSCLPPARVDPDSGQWPPAPTLSVTLSPCMSGDKRVWDSDMSDVSVTSWPSTPSSVRSVTPPPDPGTVMMPRTRRMTGPESGAHWGEWRVKNYVFLLFYFSDWANCLKNANNRLYLIKFIITLEGLNVTQTRRNSWVWHFHLLNSGVTQCDTHSALQTLTWDFDMLRTLTPGRNVRDNFTRMGVTPSPDTPSHTEQCLMSSIIHPVPVWVDLCRCTSAT